ncbi:FAD-dependent oxidoreductase [Paenibacillus sp. PAMC21692]|uniref:FAD-dependent oxidoreductase n=1 Tax=Paenibacillus sp. PAMC21692 TaxID=2762320 RepID=UPI00164DF627|nr:FAD-dependent oxidoreductase [Paenibacillus sp. PAMC21692]QNK60071.1 FAD-dependent oxidoreductase [Paenibacillus sp. PAMC21692]
MTTYDLVIYGGTSAGLAAAVQAGKMGLRAVVLEPTNRLGGLSSGGLGDTDFGDKSAIGGLSLDFYRRLGRRYGSEHAAWLFEPKEALAVFHEWVEEYGIDVRLGERLDPADPVVKKGNRLISIRMESGRIYNGRMYMDTGYEGDLMKAAGVSYATGRESNKVYGELYNGIQSGVAVKNQLPRGIDPYVVKGNPASGLLPGVNPDAGGDDGQGDHRIQAYCYRMCLTDDPLNRVFVEQPEGYDERDYELLFRAIEQGEKIFFKLNGVPNRKTDSNNDKGFSTDFIGYNDEYPEASYAERETIAAAHERHQRGLIWTLQHHERVPQEIRSFYAPWGLPLDEFVENDHWSPQLYIRESRRMIGEFVMNENHIFLRQAVSDPIGKGSYTMDSHNTQRHVSAEGYVVNEGDVQIKLSGPYPISYRSIVPKEEQCANLLVPVCLSASHIAYGSIRMEPVFMVLGQSAATAAALALEADASVQAVDYGKLRERLLEDGQVLM